MFKKRHFFLAVLLILCTVGTGCTSEKIPAAKNVKEIKVTISGGDDNLKISLKEQQNVKEIIKIHKALLNYKDNNIETWKVDLKLDYLMNDGTRQEKLFKGIRPVSDYFRNIYNSPEGKKQMNVIEVKN